ncbi:MAG TPA: hydrolase glyoxylase, partial [Rhodospirillaceae bacterium]|nr:hydrolase glyoxylase [Rhodospirillaceae bacterium]
NSIFNKLLKLPEDTLVYPAHDYKGDTVSTIGEEKAYNPRLQVGSEAEYVEIMQNLNLANPKMMDVALPANLKIGLRQDDLERMGMSLGFGHGIAKVEDPNIMLVDLRDEAERKKNGIIPGSVHTPYPDLNDCLNPGGMLFELASSLGKRIVFYCAYGERSAMAVEAALGAGIEDPCHLAGGIDAWKSAGGPLVV